MHFHLCFGGNLHSNSGNEIRTNKEYALVNDLSNNNFAKSIRSRTFENNNKLFYFVQIQSSNYNNKSKIHYNIHLFIL